MDARKPDAPYSIPLRQLSAGLWDADLTTPLLKHKPGIERVIESARISGVDLSRHTPDEQGIYRLNNMRYILQSGVVFEVYSGWLGRNWYLQLPRGSHSGASAGYKVRRTAGHWEIKHKLADNSKRWEPLVRDHTGLAVDLPAVKYSDYDMPGEYQATLGEIIDNYRSALDGDYEFMDIASKHSAAHRAFKNLRIKLLADAKSWYLTKPARPRVTRPLLPSNVTPPDLIKHLFEHSDGIVWGKPMPTSRVKKS